jgi:hypothetical protein
MFALKIAKLYQHRKRKGTDNGASEMPFCFNCGKELGESSSSCIYCGATFLGSLTAQTPTPIPRPVWWVDPKYFLTQGTIFRSQVIDFPRYYLDTMLAVENFSKHIVAFKDYDTGQEYKRKGSESFAFMPKLPLGSTYFRFEGCEFVAMTLNKAFTSFDGPCITMNFIFPQLRQGFGDAIFRSKILRSDSNSRLTAEIKGDPGKVLGLSKLATDQELLEKIGKVSNSAFSFYKDLHGDERSGEIRFHVLKNPFRWIGIGLLDNAKMGVLEIGLTTDPKRLEKSKINYQEKCKLSFEVALRIADYLKPMWSE